METAKKFIIILHELHIIKIFLFFLTQNFYQKGKYTTTIIRNSFYIILFSSPHDFGQIKYFAS